MADKNLLEAEYAKLTDEELAQEIRNNFGPHSLIDTREKVQRWVLAEAERRLLARAAPVDFAAARPQVELPGPVITKDGVPPYDPLLLLGATEMPAWDDSKEYAWQKELQQRRRGDAVALSVSDPEHLPVVHGGGIFGGGPVAFEATKEAYQERGIADPDGWLDEQQEIDPMRSAQGIFDAECATDLERLPPLDPLPAPHRHGRPWLQAAIVLLIVAAAAVVTWARGW